MTFPDGTHALDETSLRRAPRRVRHRRRPVRLRQVDAAADRLGPDPADDGHRSTVDRASLGYVFQDATLLPWRTVRRNVELLAELEGLSKAERARRAQENIDLVGLTGARGEVPASSCRAA